jgi:hypothetical protein
MKIWSLILQANIAAIQKGSLSFSKLQSLEKKRWNDLSAGTNKRQENFILSQGHDQSLPWQTEKKENRKNEKWSSLGEEKQKDNKERNTDKGAIRKKKDTR